MRRNEVGVGVNRTEEYFLHAVRHEDGAGAEADQCVGERRKAVVQPAEAGKDQSSGIAGIFCHRQSPAYLLVSQNSAPQAEHRGIQSENHRSSNHEADDPGISALEAIGLRQPLRLGHCPGI